MVLDSFKVIGPAMQFSKPCVFLSFHRHWLSAGLGCCGSCVSSDSFRTESVTNVKESNSITIPILDEYVWLSSKIDGLCRL